jgi:hypothetical protein
MKRRNLGKLNQKFICYGLGSPDLGLGGCLKLSLHTPTKTDLRSAVSCLVQAVRLSEKFVKENNLKNIS